MKKNTTKLPALKLDKETLRVLTNRDLNGVAGGGGGKTVVSGGGYNCEGATTSHPIQPVQQK